MIAGIVFTGTGPILILTTYPSLTDPALAEKFLQKGIKKYIAFEVSVDLCRERYGTHFEAIYDDVHGQDDLRILDYNGHDVIFNFSFEEMGQPLYQET